MHCRIAALLHCLPSAVQAMPASDYDLLCRYFAAEPWGAWRDNLHAAIIAREVRRTLTRKQSIDLTQFMVMPPERRDQGSVQQFAAALKAMAGPRKHVSELTPR